MTPKVIQSGRGATATVGSDDTGPGRESVPSLVSEGRATACVYWDGVNPVNPVNLGGGAAILVDPDQKHQTKEDYSQALKI